MKHIAHTRFLFLAHLHKLSLYAACATALLFATLPLFSQNPETLRILFNRTELTQSQNRLWQNALYRWTVRGRAQIGTYTLSQPQSPMIADARFFTSNLGIPNLQSQPVLPLDENMAARAICTALVGSPSNSPCNIFLATNARFAAQNQPLQQDAAFRIGDANELKPFAFRPDVDAFREDATYLATVRGAGDFAKAVFVDGLGFENNQNYRNNPADTALQLRIERISPELLLLAEPSFGTANRFPMRVLNDIAAQKVLRDTTVDFGALLAGTGVQTRRIVLKNRGAELLQILRVEIPQPNAAFSVTRSDGRSLNEAISLSRNQDSITLILTFTPSEAREYAQVVRIITNDPTNESFTLHLRGAGALGTLQIIEFNGSQVIDTVDCGTVRILDRQSAVAVTGFRLLKTAPNQTFTISSIQPPTSPFSFANTIAPGVPILPGGSLDIANGSFSFQPCSQQPCFAGAFLDSAVLRGSNLVDFKIYVKGRSILGEASIPEPPVSSDILDFGALVTGGSTTQTFTVRNVGNLPLQVSLELIPGANAEEFVLGNESRAISAVTGTTQTYTIRYTAEPQFAPGNKEAKLLVIVRDPSNPNNTEVLRREFTLRARRLPNIIAPSITTIDFGNIYIGASTSVTVVVSNSSQTLSGTTLRQSSLRAPFGVDTTSLRRAFLPRSSSPLAFTFRPIALGDAAGEFVLESRLDSTLATETSQIQMRGTGVQQRFELLRVTSDSLFPNYTSSIVNGTRVYTVDIGCVRLGEQKNVRLEFQNNGNIPFAAWNQFSEVEPAQTRDFTIVRRFPENRPFAPTEQDTSLIIGFTPRSAGLQQIRYTLQSDIKRSIGGRIRVPTAPDSTEQIVVILQGTGIVPVIDAPSLILFDDVTVGSTCGNSSVRRITVTNPTNSDCGTFTRVLSVRLTNGNSAFRLLSGETSFLVRPGVPSTLDVEFIPQVLGSTAATLVLTTDAPARPTISISLAGKAIALPNVRASISTTHSAAPGAVLRVPVLVQSSTRGTPSVNAQALALTDKVRFQLSYDASLLEFTGRDINGTASVGAVVTTATKNQGDLQTLDVNITAQQGSRLLARDTLIILQFSTYLGRRVSTDLALASSLRFGDDNCPRVSIDAADIVNGRFRLDSVCNLGGKVLAVSQLKSSGIVAELLPNPITNGRATVHFYVSEESRVFMRLLDASGLEKSETLGQSLSASNDALFSEGVHTESLDCSMLPTGTYFCEIRAQSLKTGAMSREVKKIAVVR